jgi:hypothetical protein
MPTIAIYYLSITLFTAIPFDRFFDWIKQTVQETYDKLDQAPIITYLSKAPFIFLLREFLSFLKGYIPIWSTSLLLYDQPNFLLLTVSLSLTMHIWSPFKKFKPTKSLHIILLGIYTYLAPILGISAILLFIVFSLILNSFEAGTLATIISFFFILWFLPLPPIYILINFCIFLISFLALQGPLFKYLDQKQTTLLALFESR